MLIFKKYIKHKIFLHIQKTILQFLIFFLITSCTLKNNEKKNQFNNLITPKGITLPKKNQEYYIPYNKNDLKSKDNNIFPPI